MSPDDLQYREESDLLGTRQIPKDAYWGIQTLRAQENFGVSLVRLYNYSTLVTSMAMVKKACTQANQDLGHINTEYAEAIIQTCDEIIAGELEDQRNGRLAAPPVSAGAHACSGQAHPPEVRLPTRPPRCRRKDRPG